MANAQDIVSAAYQLLGAPYRVWQDGNSIPMWLDDYAGDPPPVTHLRSVGVNSSDLLNFALEANGLPPGGGTQAFANYLVNTVAFDPASPGQRGAIAFRPYEGPAVAQQGHVALYVDEHKLIQAIPGMGVTDQYTDQATYSWGAQYAFTIYGFLPGVQYY